MTSIITGFRILTNCFLKELQILKLHYGLTAESENGMLCSYKRELLLAKLKNPECDICLYSLEVRDIYSCITCHNILCGQCLKKVLRCPYCRTEGNFATRNIALEKSLVVKASPCKYQRFGCKENVDRETKEEHEKNCNYEPATCCYCDWLETTNKLSKHLQKVHSIELISSDHTEIKIKDLSLISLKIGNKKITHKVFLYCYKSIFQCKILIHKRNLKILLTQLSSSDVKTCVTTRYGADVEVSSSYRSISDEIIFKPNQMQEIEVSSYFILPKIDVNDNVISVTVCVKKLDDVNS